MHDLRYVEAGKIACGKADFQTLKIRGTPARYEVVSTVEQPLARTVTN